MELLSYFYHLRFENLLGMKVLKCNKKIKKKNFKIH